MNSASDQNGYAGNHQHLGDRVRREHDHAGPSRELVLDEHAKADGELKHADAEHEPTPGLEVADDVVLAVDKEVRVADRGDAPR